MQICSAIHEILVDKAFTATDGLIFQSFVVSLVSPAYVQIALIWGFPANFGLWKSVYWLWRYKLNEVCNTTLKPRLYNRSCCKVYKLDYNQSQTLCSYTVTLEDFLDYCLLFCYYYQIYLAFLDNGLDTSTQVSSYLYTIILMLAQHCLIRLQWTVE